jgi:hypothetical protein
MNRGMIFGWAAAAYLRLADLVRGKGTTPLLVVYN